MENKVDLLYLKNSVRFFEKNVFIYQYSKKLNKGSAFGELGLLNNRPRSATVVANEDCYLGVMNCIDYGNTVK